MTTAQDALKYAHQCRAMARDDAVHMHFTPDSPTGAALAEDGMLEKANSPWGRAREVRSWVGAMRQWARQALDASRAARAAKNRRTEP